MKMGPVEVLSGSVEADFVTCQTTGEAPLVLSHQYMVPSLSVTQP